MKTRKPSTLPLRYVAEVHLGVSKTAAYELVAETGELTTGVPVLRVSRQWRVPTAKLEAALGIEIDPADVEHWMAEHAEVVAAERRQRAERKQRAAVA